jgi:glycopeptide antibiotics resistance protein
VPVLRARRDGREFVRHRARIYVFVIAYVVLLIVGLGMPLRDARGMAADRHEDHPLSLEIPASWRGKARDLSLNVVLFIPLGALGRRSLRHAGVARLPALLAAVGGSMALSVAMETAQHFIPGRYSSLLDVVMNAGGATIGVAGDIALSPLRRLRGLS